MSSLSERAAFPWREPDGEAWSSGMSYRNWLVGQLAAGLLAGSGAWAHRGEMADHLIGLADDIIAALEGRSRAG